MKQQFPRLMSAVKVRDTVLKNRVMATTAVPHFISGPEPYPNNHMILHHARRAAAAGVVTISHTYDSVGPFSLPDVGGDPPHFPEYNVWDPKCQNYMIMFNDAIHYYGAKSCWDLALRYDFRYDVMADPEHGVQELTMKEIDWYIDLFKEQIDLCKPLGFDMISIHCAYQDTFMARFFSKALNRRTDELGGSFENRCKVPLHVLRELRKYADKVCPGLLFSICASPEEPQPEGYKIDEFIRLARILDEEGLVDILQVRAATANDSHPTGWLSPNPIVPVAEKLKACGFKNMLIAPVGGFQDPFDMERWLGEGKADMFCAARMFIADPAWGEKIAEGRPEDIFPCILCNRCHVIANNVPYLSMCSVNPEFGIQHVIRDATAPVKRRKKVAVVGGGPGGMRAACYLADRGHDVTLYEASGRLGGQLIPASVPEFKWPVKRYLDWLLKQVAKRENIRVLLNTPATPDTIRDAEYDACIAAIGAVPAESKIPGSGGENVLTAVYALENPDRVKGDVAVIGGGETSVETAVYLGRLGHKVTILARRPEIAQEIMVPHIGEVVVDAMDATPGLERMPGVSVTNIAPDGVTYKDAQGEERFLPADTVVLASGVRPLKDESMGYYGIVPETWVIGDCTGAGNLMFVNRAAYAAANNI